MAQIFLHIGDTAQNLCDREKGTKKREPFCPKIARDYAENAPKAFVIYRFRNEHDFLPSTDASNCDPVFFTTKNAL